MIQILFAFLGGLLTVAAPCILPVLPIILGSSVGQQSRWRPLFIVAGFVAMFALASLCITLLLPYVPFLTADRIRTLAIVLIGIFGLFLVWPLPFEKLMAKFSGLFALATNVSSGQGNMNALLLGMGLGLVWAPCAGPILAAILALIAVQGTSAQSLLLLAAYALGAGIPMLLIAYGGQFITTRVRAIAQYSQRLQQIFGVLIILLAISMYFQYDTILAGKLTKFFPQNKLEEKLTEKTAFSGKPERRPSSPKTELKSYGQAPEFAGIEAWLNSEALTMQDLRGKVVLIDFWTYSCINCIRTLPYVTSWYEKYKDQGFVVVGVHTPEFAFEKMTKNVQAAIERHNITYPVAQDNNFATWNNYSNQYWPAHYLVDKQGQVRYVHFGEGEYAATEAAIQNLLGLDMPMENEGMSSMPGRVQSPEMYFGTRRLENLSPEQSPSLQTAPYQLPASVKLNNFALEGSWQFKEEYTVSQSAGKIRLKFSAGKLHMVAATPGKTMTLKITVDGKAQADVLVGESDLYTLFESEEYKEHTIHIEIPEAGFEAYTFTFG